MLAETVRPVATVAYALQQTLARVSDATTFAEPIVITRDNFRFAEQQAFQVGCKPTILLEPEARDSAPAIGVATAFIQKQHPGALIY